MNLLWALAGLTYQACSVQFNLGYLSDGCHIGQTKDTKI